MIKRYNQFVKNKINEDMIPSSMDDMSLWNKNNPHAPSKEDMDELMNAHDDDDFIDVDVEEEGNSVKGQKVNFTDTFTDKLKELADLLPGSTIDNNKVIYKESEGNIVEIVFPSETFNSETGEGIFHLTMNGKNKKFKTPQDVVDEITNKSKVGASNALSDDVSVPDQQAIDDLKESKGYRNTRKFQKYKK